MKILLDTCVAPFIKEKLLGENHDVVWTGDWEADPGDEEILNWAFENKRVLITLDKDFGELVFLHSKPHFAIIRLVNIPLKLQAQYCIEVLSKYKNEIESHAFFTVEEDRVRIRTTSIH